MREKINLNEILDDIDTSFISYETKSIPSRIKTRKHCNLKLIVKKIYQNKKLF